MQLFGFQHSMQQNTVDSEVQPFVTLKVPGNKKRIFTHVLEAAPIQEVFLHLRNVWRTHLHRLKCIQKTVTKFDTVTADTKVLGTKLL
jgi:hypothetical protein